MSRSYNQKNNKKSYCKVCHDAGKPESVYTSHYVKSRPNSSVTTCPTLRETTCRNCYKLGHTTKFCPISQKSPANGKVTDSFVIKKEILVDRKVSNAFNILDDDDISDEEEENNRSVPETPIKIPVKEIQKWTDIIKNNKPWCEYSDSDSDDDERYHFKPIHAVSITIKKNKPKPMVSFADDYW